MQEEGYLYRNNNNVSFSSKIKDKNFENLLEITKSGNNFNLNLNDYEFDEDENIKSLNSAWFLLRQSNIEQRMNAYNLKEGDILKIGRIAIRIRAINFKKNNENKITDKNIKVIQVDKKIEKTKEDKETKSCRICYIEEESEDNPLLQPCTCSGSMKYIHLKCLKQWLSTSSFIKIESNKNRNIYLYKQAECELCKSKFPDFIKYKEKIYELLDIDNDFTNYIIIESLSIDRNQNKYMYVINLDNLQNRISIGRGHDCNLKLNDISVSRIHCYFNINKNTKNIFATDNNSKFGTLILVQTKTLSLGTDLKLYLQIGRSFLEFIQKAPTNFFGCCGVKEKSNFDYYYLQSKDKIKYEKQFILKEDNTSIEYSEKNNEDKNIKNKGDITKNNEIFNLITKPNINEDNPDEIITPKKTNEENKLNEDKNLFNENGKLVYEKEEISIEVEDSISNK